MGDPEVVALSRDADTGNDVLWFDCPGCAMTDRPSYHRIPVSVGTRRFPGTTDPRKTWQWNGSLTKPTCSPSIKHPDCHFFIKDGSIQFCGDSDHPLAGKTVPLPEFTDW